MQTPSVPIHPHLHAALGERCPPLVQHAAWLCRAAETIAAALPDDARESFLRRFADCLPPHVPMRVQHQLIYSLLVENPYGAVTRIQTGEERKSITDAAALHFRAAGERLDPAEWQDAQATGHAAAVMAVRAFNEEDAESGFSLNRLLTATLEQSPGAAEAVGEKLLQLLQAIRPLVRPPW